MIVFQGRALAEPGEPARLRAIRRLAEQAIAHGDPMVGPTGFLVDPVDVANGCSALLARMAGRPYNQGDDDV